MDSFYNKGSKKNFKCQFTGEHFGSLILCPPGGQAFATAYMMACDMRRRRKRNAFSGLGLRPPTLKEMQNICCKTGCELQDLFNYCDPFGSLNS
ncbi:unnamed protein product [Dracunculus medinensis]|uniref:Insulin n=1 Tax=Dracunculus medinensis TaxID=318479 RepID=A0A0N4U5Y0_DRAME|nr:unnamed protein product [Dracunculus medinensis]